MPFAGNRPAQSKFAPRRTTWPTRSPGMPTSLRHRSRDLGRCRAASPRVTVRGRCDILPSRTTRRADSQASLPDAEVLQHAALSHPPQPQTSQTQSPPEQQVHAASQRPQTQAADTAAESATAERTAKPAATPKTTTPKRAIRAFHMIFLSSKLDVMNRMKTRSEVVAQNGTHCAPGRVGETENAVDSTQFSQRQSRTHRSCADRKETLWAEPLHAGRTPTGSRARTPTITAHPAPIRGSSSDLG
jgi:hypothetical protein